MTTLVQCLSNHSTLNPFGLSPSIPFVLSVSKDETFQPLPFMVRQAHHERNVKDLVAHRVLMYKLADNLGIAALLQRSDDWVRIDGPKP